VCGLGNRKNDLVNRVIEEKGVQAYEGSVDLIHQLRRQGFRIAVVTSSQNCKAVLKAAKLDEAFDMLVDGNTIHAQHLAGKPAPDTFLTAAALLGAEPNRTVVIEDAISGVQAGSNGSFGLVIGVARKGNAEELRSNGADLVVNDLASSSTRQSRPRRGRAGTMLHHERFKPPSRDYPAHEWNVVEKRLRPEFLAQSETMLALGNGYLGIRGCPEEGGPNAENATLINGFYETRRIVYGEDAYGFPKTGQTICNVTDGKIIVVVST
jgi:HAD superfamily hydrolase (TIGR01509 family)